ADLRALWNSGIHTPKKYRNHHESAGHQTAPTAASATAVRGHAATVPGVQSPACSAVRLSRLPALRLVALWLAARTDGLTAGRSDRHSPRFKSRSYRPIGRRAVRPWSEMNASAALASLRSRLTAFSTRPALP